MASCTSASLDTSAWRASALLGTDSIFSRSSMATLAPFAQKIVGDRAPDSGGSTRDEGAFIFK